MEKANKILAFIISLLFIYALINTKPVKTLNSLYVFFSGVETNAIVIGEHNIVENNKGAISTLKYPLLKYNANGKEYESYSLLFNNNVGIGTEMNIIYSKNDPSNIVIPNSSSFKGWILLGYLTIFILIIKFFYFLKKST